jgi:hypothetical protein
MWLLLGTTWARREREQLMEQQRAQHLQAHHIQVRQVTHVQASWVELERGAPGMLTFQLILDNGVAEHIIQPTADDAQILLELLKRSDSATFDVDRKVLMFSNLAMRQSG